MENKYWVHAETKEDAEAIRKGCTIDADVTRWEIVAAKKGGFYLVAVDSTGRFFPGDPDHPFLKMHMAFTGAFEALELDVEGPEVTTVFHLIRNGMEKAADEIDQKLEQKIVGLLSAEKSEMAN
jgi:hypothetical protein